ncbi:NACHT, LRR and PYD domains-containing protein 14-like [Rhinichthys klamathensis goyatoka]|uniref:NACHT, LRR and PYD domains-containing protein 14-like n=1 Tax=Rhinichthys klamathensis goyatoka TaxID=3034132 RepID=UPI0024B543E5|nr:NACHT, LRR and PYD domains-containing protein 14-like [Rhinichthys klamathensis goyatoka]
MATVGVNVIETAALGRPFQLGMLYDCRKDALIPGITLWDQEKLQQSLRVRPQINKNFKVTASDSIQDKSALLKIDGSLKLSVLGGLVNVTGAAKYLNDTKKSFKQQRLTLHYHSTSRVEDLSMNHLRPANIVHHEVLDNDAATHVVTAVLYGADACFVFDREVSSDEEIKTVEGEARVALEKLKLISVDVNSNLNMNYTQKEAVQKFTCKFYGDFQLPSNPTSFEYALKVFTDLPKLLGGKKELAVPLRVWLFPLDKLLSKASKLHKDISMDLIIKTESVIECLNTTEMKCNDLLKDLPALTFTAFHDKILQMKQNCDMYKLRLMKKLGSLLPNICGDVKKETDLNDLLEEHDESPFRGRDLAEWLKERERESDVIKLMLRQLRMAGAQVEDNIDLIPMNLTVGNVVCYTFTSLNCSDMQLLQQKAYLSPSTKGKTDENSPDPEQKSWLTPEIQKTMRNNLKIFKIFNLIDSKDRKPAKYIVSSKEMKNNPGSCILLYESECDEAVCFIPPSKPACPITEEIKDNSVVLTVPPSCPETVELRLLYKLKQGTVWSSKPVLKDQLTVTLTDLREEAEYEIRCAALGKLNYTVYSDVTEVVTEGKGSLITGESYIFPAHLFFFLITFYIDFKGEGHSIPITTSESCWSPGPHQSFQLSETFKLRLMEEFRYLNEEISPGQRQLLNDVFIERHITEEPDSHINNNKEIISNNIFKLRTVLMKGEAGIGKTVAVQKFILDWAEEKSNHDIEYIFPIPFQKLNIIREMGKECSFMELLKRCCENTEHLNPESRIMLIFDGLNEFKVPLDFQTTKKIEDPNKPASVCDLLTNLIMGNLLPSARIWITSRPAAANQIPAGFIDRVTEIQGFNDEQKEEYFRKSISDQSMANKVISHIQKSPRINSMCYSPDYCRIIAAIPEEMFRTDETGSDFPKTLTQMYSKLLLAQTELNPERRETIIALGKIAFDLLVKANSLFCDEDYELSAERVKASSSIIKVIDEKRKSFCFMNHRTQEFLAALYATDVINGGNPLQLRDLSSLKLEFGEQSFTDYNSLQNVMNIALQKQMDLFFCFLLGLKLESSQIALKELLTQRSSSSSSSQEIIQHIKTMIMNSSSETAVESSLLLDCLKELDDRYLIQEIKRQLKSGLRLSPDEFSALMTVLLNSEEKRDEIKNHQSEELKPRPVLKTSGEHELRSCDISDGGCADLSSALRSNPSLRELDLSENNITESEVKQLSALLKHPQCKLEKLRLRSCDISDGGCADLSSALRSNLSHLRELDLSENDIKESGVKQLSALLEDPQCKLEKLGLRSCHISDRGCAYLSSVLRSNPSLRELDLSGNYINELGVKILSDLLADPQCKLEKLGLRSCRITDYGCTVLSSALRSNPSLRKLDLSGNAFTYSGVKQISDLLKHPQCKLEKLKLRSCRISDGGCAVLSSALRSNPSLRELDLSENNITDSGVKQFSDLLKHPQCKLEKLELRSCYISNRGCADLSSALRSNPSHLRELDLSENGITDLGIKQLSDLVEDPLYKLEKLGLRSCDISYGGCADLSSALRLNPSHLRELDLSENYFRDSGVKQLSHILKDQCKLGKLVSAIILLLCGCLIKNSRDVKNRFIFHEKQVTTPNS